MPAKRGRSTTPRSRSRARSAFTRRRKITKKRRNIRVQGFHAFSRSRLMETIECNDAVESANLVYTFADMVAYDEFAALFENYRITRIRVTFQLINNPNHTLALNNAGVNTPTNWFPKLWYTVDHDGGSSETLSSMKERQNIKCRILEPNKHIVVSFKPMCRSLSYKTSTTEGFSPKNIRLDMADTNVPHYGLLYLVDTNGINPSDTYPFSIAMETKYFFTCGGVR